MLFSWIETEHIFIWIIILYVISRFFPVYQYEDVMGRTEMRVKPWFAMAAFLPVILMATFGKIRGDMWAYLVGYRNLPSTVVEGWSLLRASEAKGFTLFCLVVKQLSGGSEGAYRFLIALVHTIPLIIVLRKYSENFLLSLYLFTSSAIHLGWLMNGQRQFIAVALIFGATPWIVEKKYARSILIILLAATFHTTALFMIPVIFIVQGEAWNWKTILFSLAAITMAVYFSRDVSLFDNFADSVGYSLEASYAGGDDGMNPIRVLVYAVPAVLAFVSRYKIREEENSIADICVNMSVITLGIALIAMVTSGIMTGRMTIYTSLYNLILLPYVIRVTFSRRQKPVKMAAIVFYYLFYLMEAG